MDDTFDRKFDDSRPLSLNGMSQSALLAGIFERCHDIDFASASAPGIFSAAFSPFESRFGCHGLFRDNFSVSDSLAVRDILDIVRRLVFERGPDERTYTLAVIVDDRFAEIIFVSAAPHFLSAKSGHGTARSYGNGAVTVLFHERVYELPVKVL